jgi:hypothetical protein
MLRSFGISYSLPSRVEDLPLRALRGFLLPGFGFLRLVDPVGETRFGGSGKMKAWAFLVL